MISASEKPSVSWFEILEQVADALGLVAVDTADGEAELRRDIHDTLDIAREDEARQMQQHRGAQARAEVRRARGQVAHLLVKGDVDLRLDHVVDMRSARKRRVEVEPRRHALDAQVVLLVDHDARRAVRGDEDDAVLRILDEVAADKLLLDEDIALQRRDALEVEEVKVLPEVGRDARQELLGLEAHLGELVEVRAVRERDLTEIACEADAARKHDIALLA